MLRAVRIGTLILALTLLRAPAVFGGCDDPTFLCLESCNAAFHGEQLCIDKCQQKVACHSTFNVSGCNLKCINRCRAAEAKLLTKGCDCSAYPATNCV